MTNTIATRFAAFQPETGYIFGIGDTPEAAIADAANWTEHGTDDLRTAPCTEELAAEVDEHGGQISYTEKDGVLSLS